MICLTENMQNALAVGKPLLIKMKLKLNLAIETWVMGGVFHNPIAGTAVLPVAKRENPARFGKL